MRFLKVALIASIISPCGSYASDAAIQIKPIYWQSCEGSQFEQWFGQQEIPERLQCSYLEAPLSYGGDDLHGTVKLAATRLPATGKKRGSLLSITGGPGLAGIVVPFEAKRVNENFDIIGYDPRGVGQSKPQISCPSRPDIDVEPNTAALEKENADWVKGCVSHTRLIVLKHIGTAEAVNDVDSFRVALGEDKLSIIGFSYGTQVAQMYAERFPDKVQAMVLDGVVDLTEDADTSDYKQGLSFQRTFERFAAYCEQENKCQLNKTNATEIYHRLLKKVDNLGLRDKGGEAINADNIVRATTNTLYSSEDWPALAKLLRSIDSGKFAFKTLAVLENTARGENIPATSTQPRSPRNAANRSDKNQADQEADNLVVISCADSATPGEDLKNSRLKEQKRVEASAFSNYPAKTEQPRNICDTWPFKGKLHPHIPAVSPKLPPLLFVAQRYDPATPYEGAQVMAKAFNSPIITVNGDGHTIALTALNQCVDDEVIDYLINPLKARGNKDC